MGVLNVQRCKKLLPILPSIEQIVFSGHSNGFAAATSLSFLFLSMISSDLFRQRNKEIIGNFLSDLAANDFTSIDNPNPNDSDNDESFGFGKAVDPSRSFSPILDQIDRNSTRLNSSH